MFGKLLKGFRAVPVSAGIFLLRYRSCLALEDFLTYWTEEQLVQHLLHCVAHESHTVRSCQHEENKLRTSSNARNPHRGTALTGSKVQGMPNDLYPHLRGSTHGSPIGPNGMLWMSESVFLCTNENALSSAIASRKSSCSSLSLTSGEFGREF